PRQRHAEASAFARLAPDVDPAAALLRDLPHDPEAEPEASVLPDRRHPGEALEEPAAILAGQPRPLVAHRDLHLRAVLGERDRHLDRPAGPELDRVRQEVVERDLNATPIPD